MIVANVLADVKVVFIENRNFHFVCVKLILPLLVVLHSIVFVTISSFFFAFSFFFFFSVNSKWRKILWFVKRKQVTQAWTSVNLPIYVSLKSPILKSTHRREWLDALHILKGSWLFDSNHRGVQCELSFCGVLVSLKLAKRWYNQDKNKQQSSNILLQWNFSLINSTITFCRKSA